MIISERRADNRVFTQTVYVLSGSFDPLHPGHIEYMAAAKRHGDVVVVGVHSDEWLERKKGSSFQPFYDRLRLVDAVQFCDVALGFDDDHAELMLTVRDMFPTKRVVYAAGGNSTIDYEFRNWCARHQFSVKTAMGGATKWDSSETLLNNWVALRKEMPF